MVEWTSGFEDRDRNGRCPNCAQFPTLGHDVGTLIQERCAIPDGDLQGQPFLLTNEMWRFLLRFYRIDPFTTLDESLGVWKLPFVFFRGAQLVRPQKWGKGPFSASLVCAECDPDGPVRFDGWDADGLPVGKPWVKYAPKAPLHRKKIGPKMNSTIFWISSIHSTSKSNVGAQSSWQSCGK